MSLRFSLDGDDALIARLIAMSEHAGKQFKEATEDCVEHVRNRAVEGIANGPKTGRIYDTYFWTRGSGPDRMLQRGRKRDKPHQASARGEYPAADTGNLMRTIWGEVEDNLAALDLSGASFAATLGGHDVAIQGMIGADADYAVHLEYKAPSDGGRPFMRKALAESEDWISQRFIALRGRIVPK